MFVNFKRLVKCVLLDMYMRKNENAGGYRKDMKSCVERGQSQVSMETQLV